MVRRQVRSTVAAWETLRLVGSFLGLAGDIFILKFSVRCKAIHILFTPTLFPPCQRLEIRNAFQLRQENFGSLFCFIV